MRLRLILCLLAVFVGSSAYAQGLGNLISPGHLASAHEQIEGIGNCTKCHTLSGGLPDDNCLECHKDIGTRLKKGEGYHATVQDKKCYECHSDHNGAKAPLVKWDKNKFVHNDKNTGYRLTGKHLETKCETCHVTITPKGLRSYLLKDSSCVSCHKDIHKDSLGKKCETCHNNFGWTGKNVKFDHEKAYKLEKGHVKVKCADCHTTKGLFKVANSEKCVTCHKKDDKHKNSLGPVCADCHKATVWKDLKFNHTKTKYPLRGKHSDVKCESCHVKAKAQLFGIAKFDTCDSAGCHDTPKRGAIHGQQFNTQKCSDCHTVKGFRPTQFSHSDKDYAGYKLTGDHNDLKCEQCHKKDRRGINLYKPIEASGCDSAGCHDTKRRGKIHGAQFDDKKCDQCHTTSGWKKPTFNHTANSRYPLIGKHATATCESCHKPGRGRVRVYKPINFTSCDSAGCHDTKARGNIHGTQFKDQTCDTCHNEKGFKPSLFKHEAESYKGYKLYGKHATADCAACHKPAKFKTTVFTPINFTSCDSAGCHDTRSRGNIHRKQFKDKECASCHSTEKSWKELSFDHNKDAKFALDGKHASAKCETCHAGGTYKPVKSECISCHLKKDVHKKEFGLRCEECHNATDWKPFKFSHQVTGFKLDGAHKQVKCEDCHTTKKPFDRPGEDCAQCHTDSHLNQFGSNCTDCHDALSWEPTKFRHNQTGFRLEGGHRAADCESCHTNRDYASTPYDCISCHSDDLFSGDAGAFHGAVDTDCEICHNAYAWSPAKAIAIHRGMIFSGAHRAIETDCESCHESDNVTLINPGAASELDCEACHMKAYFEDHGDGKPAGLPACPETCSLCHNTIDWDDAKESIRCD